MSASVRQLARDEYPGSLIEIPDAPTALFLRGELPAPHLKLLTVVGSRALSSYGRDVCNHLIQGLSGYPISIVSGLALGTDTCAHEAALRAGLHTIAVPGSGLHDSVIYPRSNAGLATEILYKGGALLSEHPPFHKARVFDFPSRNRIMAGMADSVLLIEAGEKSGTLITARLAGEYNKELLCVPHRINDPNGIGNHQFLRLGATLVSEPSHILEALRLEQKHKNDEQIIESLTEAEQKLYALLATARTRDELIRISELPVGTVLTALISLELNGLIREEFGAWRRV